MSEDRRLAVLRAIVQDYVETSEPVGSKALLERHSLGVSAATVRNDMAVLEEEGLIAAPHTSAGRIPTDAGYRLFVDRLSTLKPLSGAERRAISALLDGAMDLDDVVDRLTHDADEGTQGRVAAAREVFEATCLVQDWPQFFTGYAYEHHLAAPVG